jgi:hypothetical protein
MVGDKTVSMQMRDMLSTEQRFAIKSFLALLCFAGGFKKENLMLNLHAKVSSVDF